MGMSLKLLLLLVIAVAIISDDADAQGHGSGGRHGLHANSYSAEARQPRDLGADAVPPRGYRPRAGGRG
ncbi:Hypp7833 [Branchiostoma lanceolatum]|uniref:Hypp7833 protein n=1 Tax=Branchiostoma lanceolatum TaxID=7740 RepID=A0A8J9Z4S9_BRALA|nr:Hypp7833 [Branchiostoma lanceolatum]